MVKILCIVGSLRKDSINLELAKATIKLFSPDFEVSLADLTKLPIYNPDEDDNFPKEMVAFKQEIAAADAIMFVTPEYNRSLPSVLKNALDIGSRPYGEGVWAGKPAAILGTSSGALVTALAQQHLRQILSFLDMKTMQQPDAYVRYHEGLFNSQGDILEASTKAHLEKWVEAYEAWIKIFLKKA